MSTSDHSDPHLVIQADDAVPDVWEQIHDLACFAIVLITLGICIGIALIKAGMGS